MSEEVLLSQKQLRERGWPLAQIKTLLVPAGTIKSGGRGRPATGYSLADVEGVEQAAEAVNAEALAAATKATSEAGMEGYGER